MKIGIITERLRLARWQADALRTLDGEAEFVIYNCLNSAPAKRRIPQAAYYGLNLLTIRNQFTRSVVLPPTLNIVRTHHFEALSSGSWQSLPPDLIEAMNGDGLDVIVKFGMGLLTVPPNDVLPVPILSYHHGDPSRFRGRPAGFYELQHGERTVGQIVQLLTNRLDSGRIVAEGETRAFAHSYKRTLTEAYRHSPFLLRRAVRNAVTGESWQPRDRGPAYRLPTNYTVLRFIAARVLKSLSRMKYGLTREKQWRVATAPLPQYFNLKSVCGSLADEARWTPITMPPRCRFIADPFFHPEAGLLVEGMRMDERRGAIYHVSGVTSHRLSGWGGHFSYPSIIRSRGRPYVVPEVSDWSSALAFPLLKTNFGKPFELRVPGMPRLLDPTIFAHENVLFLFANRAEEGHSVLRLWMASTLKDQFTEHPFSPIRVSPNGARMGGQLTRIGGKLIRIGQDLRGDYGDGLSFFEVTRLDQDGYSERAAGEFRFDCRRGPHTLNLTPSEMAFDYYEDRFSIFAGIRRILERRAAARVRD